MDSWNALLMGLTSVVSWPAIGYMVLGVLIGIWLGVIPGLGGVLGMILLLPFLFGWEPINAFAILLGLFAVVSTSDTIASVMLGIPGTAASQATILDGYPLAQQGKAGRALGAAFTVSAFGGVFGAVMLALSLPIITPVITAFRSGELFMLAVLGLTMVGSLSGGSITKGVGAALLGLMFALIGAADTVSVYRYTFGSLYLQDELPLIPVVMGLFAIPELMEFATRNVSISRVPKEQASGGGITEGIRDAVKHWWLATKCAGIGTYIGILPGLGAGIVDWVAYGYAVQSAKDKSKFGQGDIRGVIAPEAANNAIKGGALIPTIAFGIPGSLGMAILLGVLLQFELSPGPDMLTTDLHITFAMVWTIVLANILAAGLLLILAKQVAKVAFVPGHLIIPGVILFIFMGAWLGGQTSIGAWITLLLFGIVGYLMKQTGWARPPLVLGFILGDLIENRFLLATNVHGGYGWIGSWINLIIIALIIVTIVLAARGIVKTKQSKDQSQAGEGRGFNPAMSLPFSIVMLVVFAGAVLLAFQWENWEVYTFPFAIAIPGTILATMAVFNDVRAFAQVRAGFDSLGMMFTAAGEQAMLRRSIGFIGILIGMVLIMLVVGQKLALPLFILLYLLFWARYAIWISVTYAVIGWLFLIILYDRIIHLDFYIPLLNEWMLMLIPENWEWLIL